MRSTQPATTAETRTPLCADRDALPIAEGNTFAHGTAHSGVMHACGHDGHTAIRLGAATQLARTRNFDGTVDCIFQPAEEGLGGAQAMIDDGLFERFRCDAIFGMHNRPRLEVGRFAVKSRPRHGRNGEGGGCEGRNPACGFNGRLRPLAAAFFLRAVHSRLLKG